MRSYGMSYDIFQGRASALKVCESALTKGVEVKGSETEGDNQNGTDERQKGARHGPACHRSRSSASQGATEQGNGFRARSVFAARGGPNSRVPPKHHLRDGSLGHLAGR